MKIALSLVLIISFFLGRRGNEKDQQWERDGWLGYLLIGEIIACSLIQ